MLRVPLAIASLGDVAVGAVFVFVGAFVLRRATARAAIPAQRAFAFWWFGIAGSTAVAGLGVDGGVLGLVAAALGPERVPVPVLVAFLLAWTLLACMGLAGLLMHLLYIFRGRLAARGIGVAYGAIFLLFAAATLAQRPKALVDNVWGVQVAYHAPIEGAALVALLLLLVLPQIGGALAYGSLFFRVEGAPARYRIALVSSSLVVWLGVSLAAAAFRVQTTGAWLLFERALALAAASVVLAAYLPPRWARELFAPARAPRARSRGVDFDERVRRLV